MPVEWWFQIFAWFNIDFDYDISIQLNPNHFLFKFLQTNYSWWERFVVGNSIWPKRYYLEWALSIDCTLKSNFTFLHNCGAGGRLIVDVRACVRVLYVSLDIPQSTCMYILNLCKWNYLSSMSLHVCFSLFIKINCKRKFMCLCIFPTGWWYSTKST